MKAWALILPLCLDWRLTFTLSGCKNQFMTELQSWITSAYAARLWRGKRILCRLYVWFSVLLLLSVVSLTAFLLQNNFQKLCTPPEYFHKINFLLKALETGKCLQRHSALVLNASHLFLREFRSRPRYLPHKCDVPFR